MSTSYVAVTEGSDKNIATHTISEDSVTKHLARSVVGAGILTLPSSPQIDSATTVGDYPTAPVDVQGKHSVVIKSTFSDSSDTAKLQLIWYDSGGYIIGESSEVTLTPTSRQDSTRYIANPVQFDNTMGAASIKVHLTTAPSAGNVTLFIAAV